MAESAFEAAAFEASDFETEALGATYRTDFADEALGVQPPDWTARFGLTNVTWTVESGGDLGGQVLRGVRAGSAAFSALSWDAIDADTARDNINVLSRMRATDNTADFGPIVRGAAAGGTDGYLGVLDGDASAANRGNKISELLAGAFSNIATEIGVEWTADTWFWMRFDVQGTTLRLKRWAGDVEDEPATYDLTATDADVAGVGWAGLLIFTHDITYEWDFFSVGTGGLEAHGPLPEVVGGRSVVTVGDVTDVTSVLG